MWHTMCRMNKGFGLKCVSFFTELEATNTKEFWAAQRHRYDDTIKPTFVSLIDEVRGFDGWRIYRPHNDTRFGSAKGPYKTFIGAVAERSDGVGAFIQMSAKGLLVGTGIPLPAPDQLPRWRVAVDDDISGAALEQAIEAVRAAGAVIHGGRWDPLKRVPRGYPADHRRAQYLCWKGVEINHRPGTPKWLDSRDAASNITGLIALGDPLHMWLGRHVGPSEMTPEERFAPKKRS
jgi:uncharacterized protein (DUF2461 family)